MRHLFIFALIFLGISSIAPQSFAQQDIGGIIGDIFGGTSKRQQPRNQRGQNNVQLERIPVEVHFNFETESIPTDALLVVTAFAPPTTSSDRNSIPITQRVIGETRVALYGIASPLFMDVPAPARLTDQIDYARLEAKIITPTNTVFAHSTGDDEYRGTGRPVLSLGRVHTNTEAGQAPSVQTNPLPPVNPLPAAEFITGHVQISGPLSQFSGKTLVVRLVDNELAGGSANTYLSQTRIDLDKQAAPYNFTLSTPENASRSAAFDAWIEDWAGRKTHRLRQAIPYAADHRTDNVLRLEPIAEDQQCTRENPCTNMPTRPTPLPSRVDALARFNANKGLPRGAVLVTNVELNKASGLPEKLATSRIDLDTRKGDIPVKLNIPTNMTPQAGERLVIRARVEDKDGRVLFSNPGGTPVHQGQNVLELRASTIY
ncbi:MAG TPA: hypothetical protein ENJ46_05950 [Hellea balneolensis]|uniref:Uncharacterized protein n=1 Tax=Hellea balneolensis TaxID=287478 RepID=A0A7C3G0T8_9PROT|nr:hypothetical protein [Hellea balneolensis]